MREKGERKVRERGSNKLVNCDQAVMICLQIQTDTSWRRRDVHFLNIIITISFHLSFFTDLSLFLSFLLFTAIKKSLQTVNQSIPVSFLSFLRQERLLLVVISIPLPTPPSWKLFSFLFCFLLPSNTTLFSFLSFFLLFSFCCCCDWAEEDSSLQFLTECNKGK